MQVSVPATPRSGPRGATSMRGKRRGRRRIQGKPDLPAAGEPPNKKSKPEPVTLFDIGFLTTATDAPRKQQKTTKPRCVRPSTSRSGSCIVAARNVLTKRVTGEDGEDEKERKKGEAKRHRAFGAQKRKRFSPLFRNMIAAAQLWKCQTCQVQFDHTFEIDHIQPLHLAGPDERANLQALCRNCHGRKTLQEVLQARATARASACAAVAARQAAASEKREELEKEGKARRMQKASARAAPVAREVAECKSTCILASDQSRGRSAISSCYASPCAGRGEEDNEDNEDKAEEEEEEESALSDDACASTPPLWNRSFVLILEETPANAPPNPLLAGTRLAAIRRSTSESSGKEQIEHLIIK